MPAIASLTEGAGRTLELEEAGRALHFELLPAPPKDLLAALAALPLVGDLKRGRLTNVLRRTEDGATMTIADRAGGRRKRVHAETLAVYESPRVAVPAFALRPESALDRITATFGSQDIDFTDHPDFSSRYLLRGDDEGAVRQAFTLDVLRALEHHPLCVLAGSEGRLAYLEPNYPVWPGALGRLRRPLPRALPLVRAVAVSTFPSHWLSVVEAAAAACVMACADSTGPDRNAPPTYAAGMEGLTAPFAANPVFQSQRWLAQYFDFYATAASAGGAARSGRLLRPGRLPGPVGAGLARSDGAVGRARRHPGLPARPDVPLGSWPGALRAERVPDRRAGGRRAVPALRGGHAAAEALHPFAGRGMDRSAGHLDDVRHRGRGDRALAVAADGAVSGDQAPGHGERRPQRVRLDRRAVGGSISTSISSPATSGWPRTT